MTDAGMAAPEAYIRRCMLSLCIDGRRSASWSVADATSALQQGFLSVMLLEASIFMPYNLLAFNSIPAPLRPPCGSLLAAVFTIGLGIIAGS